MNFNKTPIKNMFSIELEPFQDERGEFARSYCQREFEDAGISASFKQTNISRNPAKYTFRGFHFQLPPNGESKLIRCETGRIFDVGIDMRPDSPSYLQWYGTTLTAEKGNMLFVPKGCAHAFLTLEPNTSVFYMATEFYSPNMERGIRHDDPFFNINWPVEREIISEKDNSWPNFDPHTHEQEWTE